MLPADLGRAVLRDYDRRWKRAHDDEFLRIQRVREEHGT
jgi:hypothetical protein